jgi:hypothetical protein
VMDLKEKACRRAMAQLRMILADVPAEERVTMVRIYIRMLQELIGEPKRSPSEFLRATTILRDARREVRHDTEPYPVGSSPDGR